MSKIMKGKPLVATLMGTAAVVTPPDVTPPLISGPSGSAGASSSTISMNENQTLVTQFIANETVTWSIIGGSDAAKFQIAPNGQLSFLTPPNFEIPSDSDLNNTYVVTVRATDLSNNSSQQTLTVTIVDVVETAPDVTAPVINGPSGAAGAATSAISVNENQTAVTQFTANEFVTWSISGGADSSKFQIAPNGTIIFSTAPNFEAPSDADANNAYVVTVKATDAAGNFSTQTLTVTVLDVAETAPSGAMFTPNVIDPGTSYSFTPSTGVVTGAFATAPAASTTLQGSGYSSPAVIGTTAVPKECIEDDTYYMMLWGGGDPELMGSWTIDFYYEKDTPVTLTPAMCQWDPDRKIYGIPITPRPYWDSVNLKYINGFYRWYAIIKPTNGYQTMISGTLWHNRVGGTNYIDRDARAVYVSGNPLSRVGGGTTGAVGTNVSSTVAGTIADPHPAVCYAVQHMKGYSTKEGGYIYVKGETDEGLAQPTASTGIYPTEVRPWPGYTMADTLISKATRQSGASTNNGNGLVNFQHDWVVFNGVRINPDKFFQLQGRNTGLGFRNCEFAGTVQGIPAADGVAPGHLGRGTNAASTAGQEFIASNNYQHNWIKDSTFTGQVFNGFKTIVNVKASISWDSAYLGRTVKDYGWWNFQVNQPCESLARWHTADTAAITAITYDTANGGWTVLTIDLTNNILLNSTFENSLLIRSGTNKGTVIRPVGSYTAAYTSSTADQVAVVGGLSLTGGFPTLNRIYIKGDKRSILSVGDEVRVTNVPHGDSFQFGGLTALETVIEAPTVNLYCQKYIAHTFYHQGLLTQIGAGVAATGGKYAGLTVTVSGNVATFSSAITLARGRNFLHITAGAKLYKYAAIAWSNIPDPATPVSKTTWTLEDTSLDGITTGVAFAIGASAVGVLIENSVFNKQGEAAEQSQLQHGHYGFTILYSQFLNKYSYAATSPGSGFTFRSATAGFGMKDFAIRKCVFDSMGFDAAAGFPTVGCVVDRNHFNVIVGQGTTAMGTNYTTGSAAYASTFPVFPLSPVDPSLPNFTSGYKPTANVQTDTAPYLKYDMWGNQRAIGSYIGPSVA